MLSVGVDLTFTRVAAVFRAPRALVAGLLLNHLVVPFVAFGLSEAFALALPVATGFLLCASAPGGPMGVMFTQRARGDLALGVSLLVVMTAINMVTVPVMLALFVGAAFEGSALAHAPGIARTIAVYLILPLLVGMAIRHKSPRFAKLALPGLKMATNLLFVGLSAALLLQGSGPTFAFGPTTFVAMALCSLFSVVSGYYITRRRREEQVALALNSGIRNFSLALLLSVLWFSDPATMGTVMYYGVTQITVSFSATMWLRSRTKA